MEGSIKYSTNPGVSITIPPCPHCGERAQVYRAVRVAGRGRLIWDRSGRLQAPKLNNVDFIPHSDGVRCMACRKLRRDLRADDDGVQEVVAEA
jgi:predicted RNA-binding Zn-ribbon protein involved in translation (DUF1610 family)